MEKIAILIPCYNEEKTIKDVIESFKKQLPNADIYVYNNNSTDNTVEIAKNAGAIVRNEYKQGKGNVIKTMFREIEADIYVLVDGDNTYPADSVYELIKPIKENIADMTVGDRITNGKYKKENKRPFHMTGNLVVKKAINKLFKSNLKDIMTGYRAFSRRFVKNIAILSQRFEVETEMTIQALDKGFNIIEVPIEYRDRINGSFSKLNTFIDGIEVCKTILKMYKDYKPLQFFMSIASVMFIFGAFVGIPVIIEFIKTKYITKVPSAILATGFMILSGIMAQIGIILDTVVKYYKEQYNLRLNDYKKE